MMEFPKGTLEHSTRTRLRARCNVRKSFGTCGTPVIQELAVSVNCASNRFTSRVGIDAIRASISFPGDIRSTETKFFATDASTQAAHSIAFITLIITVVSINKSSGR